MGLSGSGKASDYDRGRSSAEGGNGNARNTRSTHEHEAISTPNLTAVRNLHTGDAGYVGKHRA
jgi:hypothetical protein